MEEQVANAIMAEASDRGITGYDRAEEVVAAAREAYNKGVRGEDVEIFLRMADADSYSEPGATEVTVPEVPHEEKPKGFMAAVIASSKAGKRLADKENLPIPPEIEGEPPQLPRDLSKLSDGQLQKLHSEFNAALARAIWVVSVVEDDMESARRLHEYYEQREITRITELEGNAKRTAASLKAEAKEDAQVAEFAAKKQQHSSEVRSMKALRDIYDNACKTISRQWTMRSAEREDG